MTETWTPATATEVEALLTKQLHDCPSAHQAWFARRRCAPSSVTIMRFGNPETVFVVARFDERVIYFEDIEEGFAVTILDKSGCIAAPDCSQFELRHVLHQLIESERLSIAGRDLGHG